MRRVLFIISILLFCLLLGCSSEQTQEQQAEQTPITSPTISPVIHPEYIVDPYQPYTYDIMIDDANALAAMYPDNIDVSLIGHSVEGRDLTLIKMGTGDKKLLLIGSHHAREYITSSYLMNMIDKYMYAATSGTLFGGYDMAELLSQVTMYVVPMLNPDGVNLVINGKESVDDVQAVSAMAMLKGHIRRVESQHQWRRS